jgi:hypothetical protein
VICADVRDVDRVLGEAGKLGLLDFDAPIAVLLAGVLHFVPDSDGPAATVAALREAMAPGSYLLVSHATADGQPSEVVEAQRLSGRTATEIVLRTRDQIAAYFDGFSLVDPGLVFIPQWRPDPGDPADEHPEQVGAYAGVGRKD